MKNLSVFFPVFNEEKNIAQTVEKAVKVMNDIKAIEYEIIIVNDGSKDNTGKISDQLAKKYPEVRVIHKPNGGYGTALRVGFYNAKYEWIVYTDSDGQFDFSEVSKFIDKADKSDVIWGYRIKRRDPFYRILFAKGWAFSVFLFFGLLLKDVDCGFKMINRKVLEKIPKLTSSRGGMINAELAIKSNKYGFKISQVGVTHYPRLSGHPTGASWRVIVQSYIDLFKLRWELR